MGIYLLNVHEDRAGLADHVRQHLPNACHQLFPNDARNWLIRSDLATSKEVGQLLVMSDGQWGRFFLTPISSWHGWAGADVWEFLKPKASS